MGPTGQDINVIQVHPTRRCNLRCKHCYSVSGPRQFDMLDVECVLEMLGEARSEHYNALGISGGEPLTYSDLPRLLQGAGAAGYITSVTTNGLLLDERRLNSIAPHTDLLALSIDGMPESHDRLRGRAGAFEKTRAALPRVRRADIAFGFIFTLTLENLHELAWVAHFASQEGATLLQVHPLENVGRALRYSLMPPDDLELSYAFVEVARLQQLYPDMTIQFDAADRTLIVREPWRAFAANPADINVDAPLADLVSPLVLQDNGTIVPIQHGFNSEYSIADLNGGGFRGQAERWKHEHYMDFAELARRVWEDLRDAPKHLPFTNWYSAITQRSNDDITRM
jgi:Fe-coproporphyrin III synthase